jgi:S-adenosylmethionine:tRNA ribosyltransferase-isomerase
MTRVEAFDYELPEELIAATPAQRRDESRLMVLDAGTGDVRHMWFYELPELLRDDDLLVMNDAQVIPARLHAKRRTGGAVELLLVRPAGGNSVAEAPDAGLWLALVRSGGSLAEGETVRLDEPDADVVLREKRGAGYWVVQLGDGHMAPREILRAGSMPLPPYIVRSRRRRGLPVEMPELDRERYQTVYAREPGAVAAPTAGLHFTERLLDRLSRSGVELRMISLLVGPGTFRPVKTENIEDHELEPEYFHLPAETAAAIGRALTDGRRVVATGTTTCRVLEYVARHGEWCEQSGWTDLFIHPPFDFAVVGALLTNFHLPRSTLLMLVSAFAGTDKVLGAYRAAVREGYRFYSYGDATFLHRPER